MSASLTKRLAGDHGPEARRQGQDWREEMIEQIERAGFEHIAQLRIAARQTWEHACRHDGIECEARFVVFSDNNPHVPWYNRIMAQLREAEAACVPGGGYVGLSIQDGRASAARPTGRRRKPHI